MSAVSRKKYVEFVNCLIINSHDIAVKINNIKTSKLAHF